jgi:CheY-like chemotaxis protein
MNNGKGKTVLLVDDDVFASSLVVDDLKLSGFEVLFARTFSEAKEIVISGHIDAAIIDIWLPLGKDGTLAQEDMFSARGGFRSGQVLASWIKKNYPGVFLIAYSNSTEKEVIDWFRKHGNGFLSKAGVRSHGVVTYVCKVTGMVPPAPKCFIVHGHDEATKYKVKNYLQNTLKFPEPVVLHEKPSQGRTTIEKFEEESRDVDLVFVLLTPDDRISGFDASNIDKRRARQNVIFEMGYFLAKFGSKRGRVILLHKGKIELPSDIAGLIYIDISNGIEAAGEDIRRELAEFLPPAAR